MSNESNEQRIAAERRALRTLLRYLLTRGWQCVAVHDGETTSYPRDDGEVEALVFNLDEASVRFMQTDKASGFQARRGVSAGGPVVNRESNDWGATRDVMHGVLLTMGEGPLDMVADWNYTEGDRDGFNAAMQAATEQLEAELEREAGAPSVPSKADYSDALDLMEAAGGGFASALAACVTRADGGNWARLHGAFHDVLDSYREQAAALAKHRRQP